MNEADEYRIKSCTVATEWKFVFDWKQKSRETDHQPRLDAWDKCSGLVHWEDPEGWDGERGGRRDQDGEHM